jgi:hypothetical protein
MKPELKARVVSTVVPKCGEPLSNFAFKSNLRRYTAASHFVPEEGTDG